MERVCCFREVGSYGCGEFVVLEELDLMAVERVCCFREVGSYGCGEFVVLEKLDLMVVESLLS